MIKRLTADLIAQSPQYLNPLREREVDLRGLCAHLRAAVHLLTMARSSPEGNKISVIENLGATQVRPLPLPAAVVDGLSAFEGTATLTRGRGRFRNNNNNRTNLIRSI